MLQVMASTPTSLDRLQPVAARARTRAALAFADERHAGQRRGGDDAPFITHPLEVAWLLHRYDYPDRVIAAAVLHDVLEDTDTDPAELELRFGREVAELVASLSDDPSIADEAARKAALRRQVAGAGAEANAIYAADKISKTRELRLHAQRHGLTATARLKLDHYRKSLALLDRRLPCHPLVTELRRELERLERELSAGGRLPGRFDRPSRAGDGTLPSPAGR